MVEGLPRGTDVSRKIPFGTVGIRTAAIPSYLATRYFNSWAEAANRENGKPANSGGSILPGNHPKRPPTIRTGRANGYGRVDRRTMNLQLVDPGDPRAI